MAKTLKERAKTLNKLQGCSMNELRIRGAQALAAHMERWSGAITTRVQADTAFFRLLDNVQIGPGALSAESLLAHFRTRTVPAFFAAFQHPEETRAELRGHLGADCERPVVERARRIFEGQFDLLGLQGLRFGDPIDWHLEPLSGKTTSLRHWSRIPYLDPEIAGDKKVTWELNRHPYFVTLGRAYWHTRDECYAQTFVAHISAWIESNPPNLGINWASNLEVAFRAISWLWALYFFQDSPSLTPPVFLRILKSLYLHGRHLETYLSHYFSPNTHLTGEALGLFYLGTLLPEFPCARRWRETGQRILLAELNRQIRPDGVYFEQTSYYHRYTTDFYLHFAILAQANGESIGPLLRQKLIALLDHLLYITRPDGTTPFYGDDDGGRLVRLDERAANDFRAALSTGAALFLRPDYKFVAGGIAEETIWLLGKAGTHAFDRLEACPPMETSHAFPDGGYYVMRDGWTRSDNYLLLDCGPHGSLTCGHAHADALAFDLAAFGRTLLPDPGTYTYTGSAELRNWFRASAAHNTLTVAGESSSVPGNPFAWQHTAHAMAHRWINQDRFDFFEGEHNGYTHLETPAIHQRSVLFLKKDYWIVRDRVITAGQHHCDLHFHFAPDAHPTIETDTRTMRTMVCERSEQAPGLDILALGGKGQWRKEQGWVSQCYGARVEAPVCTFSTLAEEMEELVTFLVPRKAGDSRASAEEIEATGGYAYEMQTKNACDMLVLNGGSCVRTAWVTTDFAWTWVRLSQDRGKLEEMVLREGRSIVLDGQTVLQASEKMSYFTARWSGDTLFLEAEGQAEFSILPFGASRVVHNGETFAVPGPTALRFAAGQLHISDMPCVPTDNRAASTMF